MVLVFVHSNLFFRWYPMRLHILTGRHADLLDKIPIEGHKIHIAALMRDILQGEFGNGSHEHERVIDAQAGQHFVEGAAGQLAEKLAEIAALQLAVFDQRIQRQEGRKILLHELKAVDDGALLVVFCQSDRGAVVEPGEQAQKQSCAMADGGFAGSSIRFVFTDDQLDDILDMPLLIVGDGQAQTQSISGTGGKLSEERGKIVRQNR